MIAILYILPLFGFFLPLCLSAYYSLRAAIMAVMAVFVLHIAAYVCIPLYIPSNVSLDDQDTYIFFMSANVLILAVLFLAGALTGLALSFLMIRLIRLKNTKV